MQIRLMGTYVLTLVLAVPSSVQAQEIVTVVACTTSVKLRPADLRLARSPLMSLEDVMRRPTWATAAPPAVRQADSLVSRDSHASAGAIIGGLGGAVVGGLAFAHWTHRADAVNSHTGTLGGAVVGAGVANKGSGLIAPYLPKAVSAPGDRAVVDSRDAIQPRAKSERTSRTR